MATYFGDTFFCETVRWYATRQDKNWSLTGCLSFLVLSQRQLTLALTTDHHFEQAGFKALLVDDPAWN